MAKKKPFNDAFSGLKALAKAEPVPELKKGAKAPATRPRVQERSGQGEAPLDDAALFRQAIGDVEPVRAGPKVVVADPEARLADKRRILSEDEEAMTSLSELVAGEGPFDLADLTGSIEGAVQGLDEKVRRRLRQGNYAIQAQLDLHGLTRREAKDALDKFVTDSRLRGRRCVLVVHGRGLHSDAQIPVLKEGVQEWLSKGRLARLVLAFCSARPEDGGSGAVYVLLRQR